MLNACLPRRWALPVKIWETVMAVVGYYDMSQGQGGAYQTDEVTGSGHAAVNATDLTPFTLSSIDTLYVTNPDNLGFGAGYTSALPDIDAAVQSGMNLMIFDRAVTDAQTILPGGSAITVVRDMTNDRTVDVAAGAPSWFTNGPNGTIDHTTFDDGTSSSHGYVALGTLPPGAVPLLTNGNPDQVVAFVYPHGDGMVFYSTIPLDYYSATEQTNITPAEITTLFGNVQYGFELLSPICFAARSRILTDRGERPVERLRIGDRVVTRDGTLCPILWIGTRLVRAEDLRHKPTLRPIRIRKGALGEGLPRRDLRVSRQHRMLDPAAGTLVAAVHLVGRPGIAVDLAATEVTYHHLLLDGHQVIFAEGAMAESLFLGPQTLRNLPRLARQEIARITGTRPTAVQMA